MPKFVLSLCFITIWLVATNSVQAVAMQPEQKVLQLYTEHSPPGEYLDARGKVSGATAELIELLLRRLDQPATIELLPWARAFERALRQPNSGVFETVRNAERESRFKWVGPLKMHTIGLYGRSDIFKGSNASPLASNKYLACEYRQSVHVNALKRLGFTEGRNLILTVNHGDCFSLLLKGRVQLVVLNEAGLAERQLQMQLAGHQLVMLQTLSQVQLYLAFSLDIDDSSIARWQQVLEQSYLDGSMRALYQGIYSEQMIGRLEQFARDRQTQLQQ
ncbi:amino acid ABC transporter substrate-binding protein, PAAT family [Arsukibacterium tuosuense]|uniref:Amino acid ABC transporter substrate-binding protein, PAAT family n=1 Tax=Arsukibacterium tuosuense TaxID=1323745 RepID=A0A285I869_9GAMM|nr:transporter substrate-binding domain-containing protein [Arsukibacterium tuosuense]SNY44169.1 amino acid ABC transporter substrate-binding protein, PAAT family [Arsukibacterium tuosuense]